MCVCVCVCVCVCARVCAPVVHHCFLCVVDIFKGHFLSTSLLSYHLSHLDLEVHNTMYISICLRTIIGNATCDLCMVGSFLMFALVLSFSPQIWQDHFY